jgi:hypothetical protein
LENSEFTGLPHPIDMNVLVELDAAGGHCEALSSVHRRALSALIEAHLVHRVTYPAGLVIYEITDAGRRMSAGLKETEKFQCPSPTRPPSN